MTHAQLAPAPTAPALRTLYLARAAFAVVWALVLFSTADNLGALAGTLLVLYPLVDAAAAVVDLRSSATGPRTALLVNAGLSLVAVVGLAVAATSGLPAVLRVWGAWAIAAGVVQLLVALRRRGLGGQWPLVVSGAVSTLLGVVFLVQAGADDPSLGSIAGYAVGGGLLFLVSALRLRRSGVATA